MSREFTRAASGVVFFFFVLGGGGGGEDEQKALKVNEGFGAGMPHAGFESLGRGL